MNYVLACANVLQLRKPTTTRSAHGKQCRYQVSFEAARVPSALPKGREYGLFEVSSYPIGKPELSEIVAPAASVRVALESVATFRLINPEPNHRYECRWTWGKPTDRR